MHFADIRPAVLMLGSLLIVGCDDSPTEPEQRLPGLVRLESQTGDWVGAGGTYEYSEATARISVVAYEGRLEVTIAGDEEWRGQFQMPSAADRLAPGMYSGLRRYPFHDPEDGGLNWSGEGRGCNELEGWFEIEEAEYTANALAAVELQFEQHCEGSAPALRGTIRWWADDPTAPPDPVWPVPTNLWRPAPGAVPQSESYIYLESDLDDYIGQGSTWTITPAEAPISVTADGNHVVVRVDGDAWWYGDFQAMEHLPRLERGYYPNVERWPFHNPVRGGLSWAGIGRGCNELTGWFAVDEITYTESEVTSLAIRFEQHCEGAAAALRGVVQWRK